MLIYVHIGSHILIYDHDRFSYMIVYENKWTCMNDSYLGINDLGSVIKSGKDKPGMKNNVLYKLGSNSF